MVPGAAGAGGMEAAGRGLARAWSPGAPPTQHSLKWPCEIESGRGTLPPSTRPPTSLLPLAAEGAGRGVARGARGPSRGDQCTPSATLHRRASVSRGRQGLRGLGFPCDCRGGSVSCRMPFWGRREAHHLLYGATPKLGPAPPLAPDRRDLGSLSTPLVVLSRTDAGGAVPSRTGLH